MVGGKVPVHVRGWYGGEATGALACCRGRVVRLWAWIGRSHTTLGCEVEAEAYGG